MIGTYVSSGLNIEKICLQFYIFTVFISTWLIYPRTFDAGKVHLGMSEMEDALYMYTMARSAFVLLQIY